MQIDLYTKAVLTVIALALSAIALQNIVPSAYAQKSGHPVKVLICDPLYWENDASNCVRISSGAIRVAQ